MRRAAAAVATAVLATSVLVGAPHASAALAGDPIDPAPACGTLGGPACAVVDQVLTLLSPLQPVVELAGPALGDLGQAADLLTALLESATDAPPTEVATAAGAVRREIGSLSAPLLDLLRGAGIGVDALESALAELEQLVAPAPSPAPGPAPSGSSPAGTASSSSATGPTGFDGVLSAAEGSSNGGASGPSIPSVQVGGTLELGPLALPTFVTRSATSAHELARAVAVAKLVGPAVAAAPAPDEPDSSRATAVVLALCLLMLAAGLLLDQRQKARLPIRL